MSKIRVFGVAIAAVASVTVLGAGVASAEEPATGSAALLEQLSSGTGATEPVVEEEPATGSAEGLDLAALLTQLTTGTAAAETE